jgi:predicted RNA binding protein YcfA (HicA-like mRNA interferase family)
MKFPDNMRKNSLGIFSQGFNKMAGKPLNLREFQAQAQKSGWQEARVHYPGTSLVYQNDQRGKRITVDVSHTNVVQRFRFG